ncbi:MAG TPA: methylated-DNA--[protein]-cysteine S-methyltransferase [Arenimonas sp.]|nr:methylated-DNA--[protein]-cysteine S-methyltransferase [Arenimonas sp.]
MNKTSLPPQVIQARKLLEQEPHPLARLAKTVGWSPAYLQKQFVQAYGLTPAEFVSQQKFKNFKNELRKNNDVTRALYEAGFGSPSRVYEQGAAKLGMSPLAYQRGGAGLEIRYTILETRLGKTLIAATERGICAIALGEKESKLEKELQDEFPSADLKRVDAGRDEFIAPKISAVVDFLAGKKSRVSLELMGTAFQQRVWQALMKIPTGETLSYAELAEKLSMPKAARAVASTCAKNKCAVVVPCHRIIRGDGSLGGYRWGLPLKEKILAGEMSVK